MNMDLTLAYERFEEMIAGLVRLLPGLALGLVVFVLFVVLARVIKAIVQRLTEHRRHHHNLALVLGRMAQWAVLLIGLLVAATITFPTFTPANLIGALGITGIAVGFAFRDIFENFLAGILILLTEPFRINDQIIYGQYEGTVENIQTRATMIRTYDGRRVVIPNAELFKNSVTVNTAFTVRRLEYDFGIGYSDDIHLAKELMLQAIRSVDDVLHEPEPDVLVVSLEPSSVTLRARWWIRPPRRADALDTIDRVIVTIKQALTANGIDLPFPTQQILFHDQTEETDGDRLRQREGWPAGDGHAPAPRTIAGTIGQIARSADAGGRRSR